METTGKRRRKVPRKTAKVTRPFRPPRRLTPRPVIPGLLFQTASEKKVLFSGAADGTSANSLALNQTGTIQGLNFIQVGSSMFNRIGRKIEMRSVKLICTMNTLNVTRATISPDYARVTIVYDRQTNGANPVFADIYQDTEQNGTNTTTAKSGLNMNNRERFVTILDKRITIPQATATAGVLTNVFPNDFMIPLRWEEFRRLRGLTTHYGADSNPAVVGDIRTGGLFLTCIADNTAAGAELFSLDYNVRLKYVDV